MHQVGDALGAQSLPGGVDHRARSVEGDDLGAGEPGQQRFGHLSGPAPGVEDTFVVAELEALEHLQPPPRYRDRQAVVLGGVLVAGHLRNVLLLDRDDLAGPHRDPPPRGAHLAHHVGLDLAVDRVHPRIEVAGNQIAAGVGGDVADAGVG